MSVDERARHELHAAAREALGDDPAATLMSLLPPAGWADVATKTDLADLERRAQLQFDLVDRRFDQIDRRFDDLESNLDVKLDGVRHELTAVLERTLRQLTFRFALALVAMVLTLGSVAVGIANALAD